MTASPSDVTTEEAPAPEVSPLAELAGRIGESLGATVDVKFGTAKVRVPPDRWVESLTQARDEFGLVFFSWLSAIDWSNEVAVGDKLTNPVEERYELLAALGDLNDGHLVIFSTNLDRERPVVDSLTGVFPGANWHEREAAEMFGIDFRGHPQLQKLYLPEGFVGHPLRKSFPLLAREVKPWPGMVDVEGMPGRGDEDGPSEENPEA